MSSVASEVAESLREYAFWLERGMADTHRIKAYRRAADVAAGLTPREVDGLHTIADWQSLPSFGPSTAGFATEVMHGATPSKLTKARAAGAEPLDPGGAQLGGALRGDLHTHTNASDGGSPMWEMAEVADRMGRDYLAITDHSPRLRVANGLSRERLFAQWEEMERLQPDHRCRLLRGIEVDILADGALDQAEDMLAGTDVVVASVHSDLRGSSETMTRRMVAAVSNPHTLVLGHCTGRRLQGDGSWRPQSQFDAEMVFSACEMFGVAVEINSRPERRDPPMPLLELARDLGCLFAIDTDAHAPGQMEFWSLGAARATVAGIDEDRIINTWPLESLLHHARRRRP
ncbi:PHP domain-containing protein [Tessaracoccus antarcticus]|uniref:PHP domain-containing protein n=1 Tax=Tessaracoccus antarcticus TaxID=2479848 RepID=A0A3M0G7C5_9ACTN|nr:PHP domain-containing protein [Tessaracoccus antarcticus]RMB60017.1 PHP domain-containing protein [Tessaracoccus antarcticus]